MKPSTPDLECPLYDQEFVGIEAIACIPNVDVLPNGRYPLPRDRAGLLRYNGEVPIVAP